MDKPNPEKVIAAARQLLGEQPESVRRVLEVSDEFLEEGEWLYLVICPTQSGMAALDYLEVIEGIEKRLRGKFGDHVMIVSAKAEAHG